MRCTHSAAPPALRRHRAPERPQLTSRRRRRRSPGCARSSTAPTSPERCPVNSTGRHEFAHQLLLSVSAHWRPPNVANNDHTEHNPASTAPWRRRRTGHSPHATGPFHVQRVVPRRHRYQRRAKSPVPQPKPTAATGHARPSPRPRSGRPPAKRSAARRRNHEAARCCPRAPPIAFARPPPLALVVSQGNQATTTRTAAHSAVSHPEPRATLDADEP